MRTKLSRIAGLGMMLALAGAAWGYTFITNNGQPVKWNSGNINFTIIADNSTVLFDGNTAAGSIQQAMQLWNSRMAAVQFAPTINPGATAGSGNHVNEVIFSADIFGTPFGDPNILAVTTTWVTGNGTVRSEADVVFNTAWTWDSYGGGLATEIDIQRVALHELGHALGLDHPDQATPPQSVTAIMNASVSNLDRLQQDDISGGQALYGGSGGVTAPANDAFANASTITLTGNSAQATGTNVYATKEAGEPNHAGEISGTSVWWKWTAPGSGSMTITTAGSNFDTLMGVYTGSAVSALSTIASNDDASGSTRTSAVTFNATGGTTYYIAVDGWDYDSGSVTLNLNFTPTGGNTAPSITSQPVNQSVNAGQTAQFSVSASGNPTPSYQWQRLPAGSGTWSNLSNGGSYSGVTTATLSVSGTTLAMSGDQFRCVVSNSAGTATSNAAVLIVTPPVQFTSRPLTRSLLVGDAYTFQASAMGTGSLTYQWRRNGQVISGVTGGSFTLSSAALSDNGFYEVIATDANGSAYSYFQVHVSLPGLTVAGWGDNQYGQLAFPAGLGSVVAIAGGFPQSLALKSDGTVVVWGDGNNTGYNAVPAGLNGVMAVSANVNVNAALKSDGTVVVWGLNSSRQTEVPAGLGQVVAVAMGQTFGLALKADGTVVTWGDGASSYTYITNTLSSIVAVAAGAQHGMALKADGTVVTWGTNSVGASLSPPAGLNGVVAVAAWGGQCLALKADGTVVAWGANQSGEATVPGNASPAMAIAAGGSHSLALKADGSVVGWGSNFFGQTQKPAWIGTAQAISAGDSSSLALVAPVAPAITSQPSNQTVNAGGFFVLNITATGAPNPTYQWRHNGVNLVDGPNVFGATTRAVTVQAVQAADAGNYDVVVTNTVAPVTSQTAIITVLLPPQIVTPPLSRLVIAGQSVTLDATAQGATSYQWSRDGNPLANTGATLTITNATAADAGAYLVRITNNVGTTNAIFYVRVTRTNAIVAWGANDSGQTTIPAGLANVSDLSAGVAHSLALRADGTVAAWGLNDYGQTNVPAGLSGVVQVSAGASHSLALKSDGTVVAWGRNDSGQTNVPAGLSGVVQISAGGAHNLALKSDGTVVAWGLNTNGQCNVPTNLRFTYSVSAGLTHNVVLTDIGMAAWGQNNFGQTNTGSWGSVLAAQAASGYTLFIWSNNGQLIAFGGAPILPSVTNAVAISVREFHGLVLKVDGTIAAWGQNVSGENVIPAGVGNVQAVAAGTAYSLALVSVIPPTILAQPQSQTVSTGANAVFSVSASGASNYRWMKGGVDLNDGGNFSGATTATLTISNAQAADAGSYSVRVANGFGQVTSQSVALTVQPIVVMNNGGVTANSDGSLVTLSVNVQGLGSFTYQWYFGQPGDTSNPIAGATSGTLTVPQTGAQDYYWVRVSNGSTSTDSDAIPVGKWTLVDPLFGSAELSATAYGAGKYVVVGTNVGYSTNGINWSVGTIEAGADLRAVVFDGTRFVAAGLGGQVFTSNDGTTWQKRQVADTGAHANNTFVTAACGNGITVFANGDLMSSTDGASWQWRGLGQAGDISVQAVTFGANRFVATGSGSSGQPKAYQSTDGVNWTACSVPTTSPDPNQSLGGLSQVFYLGGQFVALGNYRFTNSLVFRMTSSDGVTWGGTASTTVAPGVSRMVLGNGQLLSADFRTSADGLNWSVSQPTPVRDLAGLGYGNGIFIAVGSKYNTGYGTVATASNPAGSWAMRVGMGVPNFVGYGNGRFVGVARDRIGYSLDGLSWVVTANSTTDFGRVSFGNGLFVSVSTYTGYGISHFTSTDGVTWTPQHSTISGNPLSFSRILYAGGQWVGTNGAIFTSPDTLTWTQRFASSNTLISAVTYGGGRYVGVGSSGSLVISDDGLTWSTPLRPTTKNFSQIAYGAGRFVASDTTSGLWSSPDGVQWTPQVVPAKTGGSYSGYISSLTFGGGHFRASYGNDILNSDDGVVWQVTPGALVSALNQTFDGDLLYANSSFWAMSSGSIYGIGWWRAPAGPGFPTLIAAPSDAVVANGGTATLTVSATGNGLIYQWYQGFSGDESHLIAGATGASYTTPALTQAAHFWVRVTGPGGSVDSPTVTVAIMAPPAITSQPIDVDVVAGATINLAVVATGTPAPAYQWYLGAAGDTAHPVANATSGSLAVAVPTTTARYWVRVSNSAGSVDSTAAVVTPWFERTDIKNQLLGGVTRGNGRWVVSGHGSSDYYSDDGAIWHPTATPFGGQSGGPAAYGNGVFIGTDSDTVGALWRSMDGSTWQKIFVPGASGQFNSVAYAGGVLFALGSGGQYATSLDGANWTVRALGYSSWISDVAYGNGIFVMAAGAKTYTSSDLVTWNEYPVVDTDTRITSLAFGSGKFIGVGGANQGKILTSVDGITWTQRYVYSSNGVYDVVYDGSRFAVSTIGHIILSRDGIDWHQGVFPNTSQIAAGDGFLLGVGQTAWLSAGEIVSGPVISTQPASRGALVGQTITLTVAAAGNALSYQWRKNNVDLPGATASSLAMVNFQAGDAGRYSVLVTASDGAVLSDPAWVTAVLPPQVTTQPQSRAVPVGNSVYFEVIVSGDAPSQYAWYKDGTLLSGKTEARLDITSAQASDAGSYYVIVTNAAGSIQSGVATLTVVGPPMIPTRPLSRLVVAGGNVSLSVTAIGTPTNYAWKRNGAVIAGATTNTLNLASATPADRGLYEVIASNAYGTVRTLFYLSVAGTNTLTAWGDNTQGQTTIPGGLANLAQVSAGQYHTLALKGDGTVVAWGGNDYGQRNVPAGLSGVVEVSAGTLHSVALKGDGTVVAWGNNASGQCNVPAGLNNVVWVSAGGSHTVALKNDGTLVIWGDNTYGQTAVPAGLSATINGVTAGVFHNVATKSDGTVVAWGRNDFGECNVPAGLNGVVAVQGGSLHSLALKSDGTVVAWGWDAFGQGSVPAGLGGVVAIASRANHNTAIKNDGTVVAWGWNTTGQTNVPGGLANVQQVTSGSYHNVALVFFVPPSPPVITGQPADATAAFGQNPTFSVTATGSALNYQWQQFDPYNPTWADIAPDNFRYSGANTATLQVVSTFNVTTTTQYRCVVTNGGGSVTSNAATLTLVFPPPIMGTVPGPQILMTGARLELTILVTSVGSAATYQWQKDGVDIPGAADTTYVIPAVQSGDAGGYRMVATNAVGPTTSSVVTVTVLPAVGSISAVATYSHSLVVRSDGTLWGAGYGAYFGDINGTLNSLTFVMDQVVQASGAYLHSLMLRDNGDVWYAGELLPPAEGNYSDPIKIGSGAIAVASGIHAGYFIKKDGTLWAFGANSYGQLGDGTTTYRATPVQVAADVVDVAGGSGRMFYVKANGTLWAVGLNQQGALGDGTIINRPNPVQIASGVVRVFSNSAADTMLFLKSDGTLWGAGILPSRFRDPGPLEPPGGTIVDPSPTPIQVATNVREAAVGGNYILFIKPDGSLWAAGTNSSGQLGDGSFTERRLPVQISTGVLSVAAGLTHSIFVKTNGSVWTMGTGNWKLVDGTMLTGPNATPVQILSGPLVAPAAPAGLQATVSAAPAGLRLAWNPVIGAKYYEVWRSTVNDSATAVQVAGGLAVPAFYDVTGSSGATYYYWVKAVNPAGASSYGTPVNFVFPVTGPPVILSRPGSQVVAAGGSASIAVNVGGATSYVWKRNGAVVAGATTSTLNIANATLADRGLYEMIATNAFGSARTLFHLNVAKANAVTAWGDNANGQISVPVGLENVTQIGAGQYHTLALKGDGTVAAWGGNDYGQSTVPGGLSGVVAVAAGTLHSVALKGDGTVVAWGNNASGQCNVPGGLNNVVWVSAGGSHTVALKNDGTLVIWGDNTYGQTAVPAGLSATINGVVAGVFHNVATKSDGTVVAWGRNDFGECNVPAGLSGVVAVQGGSLHSLALKSDGTVVAWGWDAFGQGSVPAGLSGVVAIASRANHNTAVKSDGTVVAWGWNTTGQTNVPGGLANVQQVTSGSYHNVALVQAVTPVAPAITTQPSNQTVTTGQTASFSVVATGGGLGYQWRKGGNTLSNGGNLSGVTGATLTITNAQAGDAGSYDVVVSNSAGTVTSNAASLTVNAAPVPPTIDTYPDSQVLTLGTGAALTVTATNATSFTWKHNGTVVSGATTGTLNIVTSTMADAGLYEAIATNATGSVRTLFYVTIAGSNTVTAWGDNTYGQTAVPGGLVDLAQVSAGQYHTVALKGDKTVVAWGRNDFGQTNVPAGLTNVAQVSAGTQHSVAVKSDGTVVAWGNNGSGQCNVPAGLSEVVWVSAGGSHTVALKRDGNLVIWGDNTYGQTAVPAGLAATITGVSAGVFHNLATKSDGTVVAWGRNDFGECNVPAGLSGVIAVQGGSLHSLALKSDGTVVAWGWDAFGQGSVPAGLSGVVAIASRANHNAAVKSDGTVVAWGWNTTGQTNVPGGLANVQQVAAGSYHNVALVQSTSPVTPVVPAITTQPSNQAVTTGQTASFSVVATGGGLGYQWRKGGNNLSNGGNLSGVAGATLTITNAQAGDAGSYDVVVTNTAGTVTSNTATLTVNAVPVAPTIPTRPLSQQAGVSGNASLSVTASGATSFVWKRNGIVLPGVTTNTLNLAPVTLADRGLYEVIASNAAGSVRTLFYFNAVTPNTALVVWGDNAQGQTAVPAGLGDLAQVSSGQFHTLALKADGTVAAWGGNDFGQCNVPAGLTGVVQVSAGTQHSVAVKSDGTVVAWGNNGSGQCNVPGGLNNVVWVSAGGSHTVALKNDGTLVIWGDNTYGQTAVPAGLSATINGVTAGVFHNVATKSDGTVVAWGRNDFGECNVPAGLSGVVAVQGGSLHSLALKSDGTVVAWGWDAFGQGSVPAGLTGVSAISTRANHNAALKSDGTVVAWGWNTTGQATVPGGLTNGLQIAAGSYHNVFLYSAMSGMSGISLAPSKALAPVASANSPDGGANASPGTASGPTAGASAAGVDFAGLAADRESGLMIVGSSLSLSEIGLAVEGTAIREVTMKASLGSLPGYALTNPDSPRLELGADAPTGISTLDTPSAPGTATSLHGQLAPGLHYVLLHNPNDARSRSRLSFTAEAGGADAMAARITGLAVSATAGPDEQTLEVQFTVAGSSSQLVLLSGVGLAAGGPALRDPQLVLLDESGQRIAQNNDWWTAANAAQIPGLLARARALAPDLGETDAAILIELRPGRYSVRLTGATAGMGLLEFQRVR